MDFLLITLAVLAGCVFCTFKAANRFGLNLNIRSLLLCSLCALVINLFLPYIILQFSNYQLCFMFALIVTSAFFITQYNERLNMRALASAAQDFAPEASLEATEENTRLDSPPKIFSAPEEETALWLQQEEAIHLAAPAPRKTAVLAFFTLPVKEPKRKKRVFPRAEKVRKPDEAQSEPCARLPALVTPTVAERVAADMENAKLLKLTAVLAKLSSLDALLDYAYAQKNIGAYENAIFAFKQALERYRHDSYAPFIVIELCNIYKKAGLYDEAIVIYKRAFQLPAVRASEQLEKEFRNTLAYLRIVRETLLKCNCLKTPFEKIPAALLEEIEQAFHNWRKKKHAS